MPDVFTFTSVTRVTPSGGTIAGGTAVTITGFGFDFATGGVTMGGSAMTSVVFVSNTSITAVTPAHNIGSVDVVVAGVGTGTALYTYSNPSTLLMPPVPVTADGKLDPVGTPKWLMEAKRRIEALQLVDSGSIIGPIAVDQVPQLPFTKIDLTTSPRLLGRTTAGAGAAEEIEVAAGLTLSGGILSLSGLPGGYVIGDLLYADSANSLARLADVSVGSYLRSGGVATAPLWSTLKIPNAANSGDILRASSANTYASVAPEAFVRVNDTNVTATLTGNPTIALVNTLTMTLGWTGTLGLSRGGTAANLSATGGTGQVLKQTSVGAAVTVATVAASEISSPAALTKTDDTNVTLTLTGSPTVALLAATNIAAGWTGTLSVARGGTGGGTAFTAGSVVFAGASGVYAQDNANFFWDDTNNRLGLGANASLAGVLHIKGAGTTLSTVSTLVEDSGGTDIWSQRDDGSIGFGKTFTIPSTASFSMMRTNADFSGAVTITNNTNGTNNPINGLSFQIRFSGNQEFGRAGGIEAIVESGNTHSGNILRAIRAFARIGTTTGLATTLMGGDFVAQSDSSTGATITTLLGLRSEMKVEAAGVTATNAYGLQVADLTNTGTITNTYGVYIGDVTAGTQTNQAYGLYSVDTGARNFIGGTLELGGKLTTYNSIVTAGWGAPAIYGSGRSAAQTAAVASVAAYTVGAADGSFVISANVNVTVSTTHNFAVQVTYTDETNTARTQVLTLATEAGVSVTAITNVTGVGTYSGFSSPLRVKASTAITVKTAGTFTTVTYNVEGSIRQVA